MAQANFGEVITAMVTPFRADGSLHVDGARKLASYLVDHGSDGLVVAGTTGESPTLSHDEKLTLFETIVTEVAGRAKVIAGTGTNNTAESVTLTREAGDRGVDACLVVTPYYNKPAQNALIEHFTTIADASSVPVIVYDVPPRTSRRIEVETMVRLAEHDRIVADKDAVGDAGETARLRAALDDDGHDDFEIYSGDDGLLLPQLAAGAVGIISVCAHVIGRQMKQIFAAWGDGKVDEARRIYLSTLPLVNTIMGVTTSPVPVKAALGMLGLDVGDTRLPLVAPTSEERDRIQRALEDAGLL